MRMRLREAGLLVAVVLPPLLLAVMGTMHPRILTDANAQHWRDDHLLLLPVFPLLGVAPWLFARRLSYAAGVATAVLGYVYGVFYTALDVLAGIGAGTLQLTGAGRARGDLFRIGDDLAAIGTIAYLLAVVIAVVVVLLRGRRRLVSGGAGLVLVAAAVSFRTSHIFWPEGVITVAALAVGWAILALAQRGRNVTETAATRPGRT